MFKKYRNVMACVAWLMVAMGAIVLPACNTVEGAGRDVEKGGEELKEAAQDAKN